MDSKPAVLVIASPHENWYKLCEDFSDKFTVEQACWEDILVTSYPKSGCMVRLFAARYPVDETPNLLHGT